MWKRADEVQKEVSCLNPPTSVTEQEFGLAPTIGANTLLRGEIQGRDDLRIEGRLEGRIDCPEASVTVCRSGLVFGNIRARILYVEGEVNGDVVGAEKVSIARTGSVYGNVTAPTVSLDEGAKLKGMIDMEPQLEVPTAIEFIPGVVSEVELTQKTLTGLHSAPKLANGSGY